MATKRPTTFEGTIGALERKAVKYHGTITYQHGVMVTKLTRVYVDEDGIVWRVEKGVPVGAALGRCSGGVV